MSASAAVQPYQHTVAPLDSLDSSITSEQPAGKMKKGKKGKLGVMMQTLDDEEAHNYDSSNPLSISFTNRGDHVFMNNNTNGGYDMMNFLTSELAELDQPKTKPVGRRRKQLDVDKVSPTLHIKKHNYATAAAHDGFNGAMGPPKGTKLGSSKVPLGGTRSSSSSGVYGEMATDFKNLHNGKNGIGASGLTPSMDSILLNESDNLSPNLFSPYPRSKNQHQSMRFTPLISGKTPSTAGFGIHTNSFSRTGLTPAWGDSPMVDFDPTSSSAFKYNPQLLQVGGGGDLSPNDFSPSLFSPSLRNSVAMSGLGTMSIHKPRQADRQPEGVHQPTNLHILNSSSNDDADPISPMQSTNLKRTAGTTSSSLYNCPLSVLAESCIASAEKERILKKRSTHTIEHMEDVNNSFVNSFPVADQHDRDRDCSFVDQRDRDQDHSSSSEHHAHSAAELSRIMKPSESDDGSPGTASDRSMDKDSTGNGSFIDISFSEFSVLNSSMEGDCQSPDSTDGRDGRQHSANRSGSATRNKSLEASLIMSPIIYSSSGNTEEDGAMDCGISMHPTNGMSTRSARSSRQTRSTRSSLRMHGDPHPHSHASSSSSDGHSQIQDLLNSSMKRKHVNISGYTDMGESEPQGEGKAMDYSSSSINKGEEQIIYGTSQDDATHGPQEGHMLSESGFTDRDVSFGANGVGGNGTTSTSKRMGSTRSATRSMPPCASSSSASSSSSSSSSISFSLNTTRGGDDHEDTEGDISSSFAFDSSPIQTRRSASMGTASKRQKQLSEHHRHGKAQKEDAEHNRAINLLLSMSSQKQRIGQSFTNHLPATVHSNGMSQGN